MGGVTIVRKLITEFCYYLGMPSPCKMISVLLLFAMMQVDAGIVGDQVPAQYPVIDVHLPEPAVSKFEKQLAATESQEKAALIGEVRAKLEAMQNVMLGSVSALSAKIEAAVQTLENSRG